MPSTVFGQNTPSNRIHLAAIGVGGRGSANLWNSFAKPLKDVRVVAACDCYRSRREAMAKRLNDLYGKQVCRPMADYREVLARPDVDAVLVSTPDHWHVPLAYQAALAKKDMYVEKPLGVAMTWAWKLRELVRKNQVIFQYGTQQRSGAGFRRTVELVRNGYIGKVKHVDAWCAGMRAPGGYETSFNTHYQNTQPTEVPEGLDYDMWTGPAPIKPYTKSRTTQWGTYHIYDYALGFIAGWGAHPLDIAQWGLDKDATGPVHYEGEGRMPPAGLFDTIDYWDMHCRYADGVTLRFMCTRAAQEVVRKMDQHRRPFKDHGTTFFGDEGWLSVDRGGVYASTRELQGMEIKESETKAYRSPSQARNFIDCVKSRRAPINPLESAIRSDTISHLSDISIRSKRSLQWDPEKEQIVNDAEATKMLDRPLRLPLI